MTLENKDAGFAVLLQQICQGEAKKALLQIDEMLKAFPFHAGLLTLKAEALRVSNQTEEAIIASRQAGAFGGGARNWLVAGSLLANERRIEEALTCLRYALADAPEDESALHLLVTTFFNAGRAKEGEVFARRLLKVSQNPKCLTDAALLLESNGDHEESVDIFKRVIASGETDLLLIAAAFVPGRFTCEWDWLATLEERLLACYAKGQYALAHEYPMTHISWCADERHNFEVTRCHVEKFALSAVKARAKPVKASAKQKTETETETKTKARLRVGYLSDDFRNHAVLQLIIGVFEHHDRTRFEIFAYDYSINDGSVVQQRFLSAVEHRIDVSLLNDKDAANRIAEDHLDILIDLKGHTGAARLGIMNYRPAPVSATYLGYPGAYASDAVDYVISDRFVTPDSSKPFYTEKLCRLPHSYQSNDNKRPIAADNGGRAAHGLPEDRIVYCVFNQSRKIDRGSFDVWLKILQEVPNSVLWILKQTAAAEKNLKHYASLAGIAANRFIFAEFAVPAQHLARLALADIGLDTLIYNGHTTTSDTLWAGTPVVTARGSHFASRVSESLLNAIHLPELVAKDRDEMVKIAVHLGKNKKAREALRQKLAEQLKSAPLFDTARFTKNFESAISEIIKTARTGKITHLDIKDCEAS